MARTKQTARDIAGRKKIAKKSALATKAPVRKTQTSKRKGYGFPFSSSDWTTSESRASLASETLPKPCLVVRE